MVAAVPKQLVESVQFAELDKHPSIEADNAVIRNVRVLGTVSKRGRVYEMTALQDAARLYEGINVCIDHPPEDEAGRPRDPDDVVGVLENCRVEQDGVYADLRLIKTDPRTPKLLEMAEAFKRSIGLSHNAVPGETFWGDDEKLHIVHIVEASSVDIVTKPATNDGLFESEGTNMAKPKLQTKTVREILEGEFGHRTIKRILEADGDALAAMPMDERVEVQEMDPAQPDAAPTDLSADAQMKAAIRAAIMAAVDDETLDTAATISKIKEILKAQEKLSGETPPASEPVSEADGEEEPDGDEKQVQESAELAKARRELEVARSRDEATRLLESKGVVIKPHRISTLAATPKADRDGLLAEWKQLDGLHENGDGEGIIGSRSGGGTVLESDYEPGEETEKPEELLTRLRDRTFANG